MKQHAMIIGRQGQVARALAEFLPSSGLDCTIIGRPEIDITAQTDIIAVIDHIRPSVVINPAAFTAVDHAEDEIDLAFAINATAAGCIASAAASFGIPIIHVSTDYVFDGTKNVPYVETDATAPCGVYGKSKLAGELAVTAANPAHVIIRTSWVCSPYGSNFVKTMLRLATETPELRVVDDQYGAPTFAADIAAATAIIAHKLITGPVDAGRFGTFHFASSEATTWCRFARSIMEQSAQRGGPSVPVTAITTHEFPTKVRRPAYSMLGTSKIFKTYGISAPDWHSSLGTCLDHLIGQRLERNT